jgi:hypothetical protein
VQAQARIQAREIGEPQDATAQRVPHRLIKVPQIHPGRPEAIVLEDGDP